MKHPTVVPNDSPAPNRSINYDSGNAHDNYMCSLRLDAIRSGIVDVSEYETYMSLYE